MKELMKAQENDEIFEEGRKMISKIDTNLKKTQERFFKKKDDEFDEVFLIFLIKIMMFLGNQRTLRKKHFRKFHNESNIFF